MQFLWAENNAWSWRAIWQIIYAQRSPTLCQRDLSQPSGWEAIVRACLLLLRCVVAKQRSRICNACKRGVTIVSGTPAVTADTWFFLDIQTYKASKQSSCSKICWGASSSIVANQSKWSLQQVSWIWHTMTWKLTDKCYTSIAAQRYVSRHHESAL